MIEASCKQIHIGKLSVILCFRFLFSIHRLGKWVPPFLLKYKTTVVLSFNIMTQDSWM